MTMISSISGDACMAAMVCSMIGLPAILISCLGMLSPTRVPVPPASTTATVRNLLTGRHYRPRTGCERVRRMIKVSVVVPVYNPGQYLRACVDSLTDADPLR